MKTRKSVAVMWILIILTMSSGPLLLVSGLLPTRAITSCDLKGSEGLDKDMQRFLADRRRVMQEVVDISQLLISEVSEQVNDLKEITIVSADDRREYEITLDAARAVIEAQAGMQALQLDELLETSLIWVQLSSGCWALTDGK